MFTQKVQFCIPNIYKSIMFQESNNNANLPQEKKSPVRFEIKACALHVLYSQELLVNLNYSDPQDAESDIQVWGNVNQAYEAEDIIHPAGHPLGHHQAYHLGHRVPHQEPAVQARQKAARPPPPPSYKVKFGQDIYYCKPYQPFHTQLRYNFSGQ